MEGVDCTEAARGATGLTPSSESIEGSSGRSRWPLSALRKKNERKKEIERKKGIEKMKEGRRRKRARTEEEEEVQQQQNRKIWKWKALNIIILLFRGDETPTSFAASVS
jgi:hypothetical protein